MERKIKSNEIVVIEKPLFTLSRNEQSLLLGGTNFVGNDVDDDDDPLDEGRSCMCKKGFYKGWKVENVDCLCKKGSHIEVF